MPPKLHIGAGTAILDGWVNIDIVSGPGIDHVLDVTKGLPFEGVSAIFAEHFLEHLELEAGLRFLAECRRVLRNDGVLRLSTPNLDWVWLTHYRAPELMTGDEALRACLEINRAFHGWGHRFLWNSRMLTAALHRAGFAEVQIQEYGESKRKELRALERHEASPDSGPHRHVVIAEASGMADADPTFDDLMGPYLRDLAIS